MTDDRVGDDPGTDGGHGTAAAPVFRGHFVHALDEKGRLSFPSEWRRSLADGGVRSVVMTNWVSDGNRCLHGFSLVGWEAFEAKLRGRSRFDPAVQKLERFYLSKAAECPIDASGRILIPQNLRAYAGVEREVTFAATSRGFEAWDKRVWEVAFASVEQELLADPALFAGLDL